jgi:hypothetical protein
MRRRFLAPALIGVLAVAGSGLCAAPAQACANGSQNPGAEAHKTQDLPTGGYVYGDRNDSSGYTGVTGTHGYLEAGGNRSDSVPPSDGGVYVQGRSNDAPLEGRIFVGPNPSVCVNGTGI